MNGLSFRDKMDRIDTRNIMGHICCIIAIFLVITTFSALMVGGDPEELEASRLLGGGEWTDDLSDQSHIISTQNVDYWNEGFTIEPNPTPVWQDNFESYTHGQNIIGSNGWIFHDNGNHGTVKADNSMSGTPSNTVCVMDNTDESSNQGVLSSTFNIAKGKVECYLMTNYIWDDDHTSTKLVLHGSTTTSPDSTTRLVLIGFNENGFSYYSSTSGGYVNIYSSASTMTWYKVTISFDCTISKYNVMIESTSGSILGDVQDIPMENSYPSVRRLGINTGRENVYPFQQDFISYMDDVKVFDHSIIETGEVITEYMELEGGNFWSTLYIDQFTDGGTLKFEFLDESGIPYQDLSYDDQAMETDIRFLNGMGIRGFSLKFIFSSTPLDTVVLRGWSYEWNSSGYFYDGFNTGLLIEDSTSNLKMENGILSLGEDQQLGMIRTVSIEPSGQFYWDSIQINSNIPPMAKIYVDVFYGLSLNPINGYTHLTGDVIDISSLDPSLYDNISLRLRFENWSLFGPTVDSITVHWIPNSGTELTSIDFVDTVYRGIEEKMVLDIEENEQPIGRLDVSIDLKHEDSTYWTSEIIVGPYYNSTSDKWECLISPGLEAEVGNYTIRVQILDDFLNLFEYESPVLLKVLNNLPSPPQVELRPASPRTVDDIKAVMTLASEDADSPSVVYDYMWYLNGEHVSKYDSFGVIEYTDRTFDSTNTKKGDVVTLEVFADDGLNKTGPYTLSRTIRNTPPLPIDGFPGNISMVEDTPLTLEFSNITYDIDGDPLEITSSVPVNFALDIDNTAKEMTIGPDQNWFGTETITLTVSDGDDQLSIPLKIDVMPVNDLPEGAILLPEQDMEIEVDTRVTLSAEATDVETYDDDLDIIWMKNETEISDELYHQYLFNEVGFFNITCHVDDGDDRVLIGYRMITVVDSTPEYLKDDFKRTYADADGAILYDVVDFEGNIEDVREVPGTEIDIISLVSELKGEDVRITMTLGSSPAVDDPSISYYVFFPRPDWEEPQFDSGLAEADTADGVIPPSGYYFSVGTYGSLGYLKFDSQGGSYGDPAVDGNNITWSVPAVMIVNSIDDLENLELYGVSLRSSETSIVITKGFDTIGKGSGEHTVTDQPGDISSTGDDENGISILTILLLIILVILIVVIIGLILVIMRSGKGKEKGTEKESGADGSGISTPADPALPSGTPVQGGPVLPQTKEPAPPRLGSNSSAIGALPGAQEPGQTQNPSHAIQQTGAAVYSQTEEPAHPVSPPVPAIDVPGPVPPGETFPDARSPQPAPPEPLAHREDPPLPQTEPPAPTTNFQGNETVQQ